MEVAARLLADQMRRVVPGLRGSPTWASTTTASTTAINHMTPQKPRCTERQLTNRSGRIRPLRSRAAGPPGRLSSPCTPPAYPMGRNATIATVGLRVRRGRPVPGWAGARLRVGRGAVGKSLSLTAIFFVIGLLLLPLAREGRRSLAPE